MSEATSFTWSDAWILAAIAFSQTKDGAGIDAIVSAADYMNHAIPTKSELDGAFEKLGAAGLVQKNGEMLLLAGRAARFFETRPPLRAFEWMGKAEELLELRRGSGSGRRKAEAEAKGQTVVLVDNAARPPKKKKKGAKKK